MASALGDPTEVMERRQVEVPAPGTNEVRIAVEAFCRNFNDIVVICGRFLTLPLPAPSYPAWNRSGSICSSRPERTQSPTWDGSRCTNERDCSRARR